MTSPVQSTAARPDFVSTRTPASDKLQSPAEARAQLNAGIVQSSIEVSITAGNETMKLLLKSVVANINDALQPYIGDKAINAAQNNPIQQAMSQDNSPQATAERIVGLATGFFDAFKTQHPGGDQQAVLDHFLQTIKGGIDQGFKEARNILNGLGVLQGDIAGNIDRTYQLVQGKLADFSSSASAAIKQSSQSG